MIANSMNKLINIILAIIITACSNAQKKKEIIEYNSIDSLTVDTVIMTDDLINEVELDSALCGLNFKPGKNYKIEKFEINKIRNRLSVDYLKTSDTTLHLKILDSAKLIFIKQLLNNIIPYWYETEWNFNGYTSIPNQGTIACGYFVSTTLRDMGVNLNRYTLAQQGPENEAKSIAINLSEVMNFDNSNINKKLKKLKEGLYFIGLDFHVGYLYIKNNIGYFLHSNYIDGKVMIENIDYSEAFISTNYYVSKISENKRLIKKWLTKEEIQVIIE